ncbi:MAG: DUF2961 domain-containing protein [Acidimicrobiia bacterium]|nr:DUF2961 domain-containing protein [Acidimicrobiia bacterium]
MHDPTDLTAIPDAVESRAVTFENPTGARGGGGRAHGGRKGSPSRRLAPGERVVVADLDGPGVVRHLWLTFTPAPPEETRAVVLEVFYGDATEASISVPAVDFFGVPWGRPVHLDTALTAIHEGRGYNSHIPMPFTDHIRVEITNGGQRPTELYFQCDYTLEAPAPRPTFLHAAYRRENPTTMRRDFVIADGIRGPGRFLGCVVGVRVLDGGMWYGEGEVKMYVDGDRELPTICGTGLEDYVGTAWGMGPHQARYAGAPLDVRPPERPPVANPDLVGFYRWHVPDPVYFREDVKVTIQQIGMNIFYDGQEDELAAAPAAGAGYRRLDTAGMLAIGLTERSDDYCATAFTYATTPQPVPRLVLDDAVAGIERRDYEQPSLLEVVLQSGLD